MPCAMFRSLQIVAEPKGKVALAKLKAEATVKGGVSRLEVAHLL
ncbi:hypothetical protein SDC9_02833 [bioreactor metagenome]|uniref:Uncharacterized protein n=1 Tax=bioreactor metagenome TaxID=1076179 RepID=A0A644SUG7_9ZZZZ